MWLSILDQVSPAFVWKDGDEEPVLFFTYKTKKEKDFYEKNILPEFFIYEAMDKNIFLFKEVGTGNCLYIEGGNIQDYKRGTEKLDKSWKDYMYCYILGNKEDKPFIYQSDKFEFEDKVAFDTIEKKYGPFGKLVEAGLTK